MKTLFLDESGTHSLTSIEEQYPVFVLAGVICDSEYASGEMERRVREFKGDLLGHPELILHTADIARAKNGFHQLREEAFRRRFYAELNGLMLELQYCVVACAIKKHEHVARYGRNARDPYHFSLEPVVERFCYEIGGVSSGGQIIAECRRPELDTELKGIFDRIRLNGTAFVSGAKVRNRIGGLACIPKSQNISGMQLADLVASPIGRFVLGKPVKPDFEIVRRKLRGGPCDYSGRGLVVLPK